MNNIQDKKYFDDISEAIKVYEEFRKYKNEGFIETIDPDFFFNLTDCIKKEYAKQKQENEELRKKIKELEEKVIELESEIDGQVYWASTPVKEIEKMWISKQKIKDEIEELNKAYEDSKNEYGESEYYYPDYTIQVLEEILEGRKVRC